MKTFKTIAELVALMKGRGLRMDCPEEEVCAFLKAVNYYRITGYALPMLQDRETFKPGSRFSELKAVYDFDRRLRDMFSEALEVIELNFRSVFAHEFAKVSGTLGYLDETYFQPGEGYRSALGLVMADYRQSQERCAWHFKQNDEEPPIWALVEVTTFGHLSQLYKQLKPDYREPIATLYGFESGRFLASLLQQLCVMRNRCAHHSRLYDLPWGQRDEAKDVGQDPKAVEKRRQLYNFQEFEEWKALRRQGMRIPTYRTLFHHVVLVYRLLRIIPSVVYDSAAWRVRMCELLEQVPVLSIDGVNLRAMMGEPKNPLASPLWV